MHHRLRFAIVSTAFVEQAVITIVRITTTYRAVELAGALLLQTITLPRMSSANAILEWNMRGLEMPDILLDAILRC